MSHHRLTCGCSTYVKATLCAGQLNAANAPVVVVHTSNLPASATIFKYGGYCYTIDPSDPVVCRPAGAIRVSVFGTGYIDCADCIDESSSASDALGSDDDDDVGGGGGGGGGGGPGGGGGGPGGEDDSSVDLYGFPAQLCGDNTYRIDDAPEVWVIKDSGDPAGTFYFRFALWCYVVFVGDGDGSVIPNHVTPVRISGSYDTCEDCVGGVPATICAGQIVTEDAPDVWVKRSALGNDPIHWRDQTSGLCMYVNPASPIRTIPPGAKIVSPPRSQFSHCDQCVSGVVATLCYGPSLEEDQPNPDAAPIVWVPEADLPDGVIYWRHKGWCYSIDPDGALEPKPEGADVLAPSNEYADCAACNCGLRDQRIGVRVEVCDNQYDAHLAQELWVLEEDLPTDTDILTFKDSRGICRFVDVEYPHVELPSGATVINPFGEYKNCWDCVTDRLDSGESDGELSSEPELSSWSSASPTSASSASSEVSDGDGDEMSDSSQSESSESDGQGGGGNPPPWEPPVFPPPPWWPPDDPDGDPPDEDEYVLRLYDCTLRYTTNLQVFGLPPGRVVRYDENCYRVRRVLANDDVLTTVEIDSPIYYDCTDCRNAYDWIRLTRCSDDTLGTLYIQVSQWLDIVGSTGLYTPVFSAQDNECYYVKADSPRLSEAPPGANQISIQGFHENCAECDPYICLGCGDCCFADNSTLSMEITLPGSWACGTHDGGFDGDSSYAGGLLTLAYNGTGLSGSQWLYQSGTTAIGAVTSAQAFHNCSTGQWTINVVANWDDGSPFVASFNLDIDPVIGTCGGSTAVPTGDCCGLSGTMTVSISEGTTGTQLTGNGTVSLVVNNNKCCNDGFSCTKAEGDCAGDCVNPLP